MRRAQLVSGGAWFHELTMPAIIQPPSPLGYVAKEEPKELLSRITYLPTSEYNALTTGLPGIIYEDTQTAGRPQKRWDPVALAFVGVGSGSAVTIVDDVVTGGPSAALSAEQGKVLKTLTDQQYSALLTLLNALTPDLTNATGFLLTTKIKLPSGEAFEAYLNRILTPASASDPHILLGPTLTIAGGVAKVNAVMTATAAAVTDGSGGATALDYGGGNETNTSRRHTTTALTQLNETTGWTVSWWGRLDGSPAASDQAACGFGTLNAANSFWFGYITGTGKIGVILRDGSGAAQTIAATAPAAGDYLFALRYSDALGIIQLLAIPKNFAGTVVTVDALTINIGSITPATGWYFGGDAASNYLKFPAGEFSVVPSVISDANLKSMAGGQPVTAFYTPQLYYQMRQGPIPIEPNLGSVSNADATLVGTGFGTVGAFFATNSHLNEFEYKLTAQDGTVSTLFLETKSGNTSTLLAPAIVKDGTVVALHTPIDSVTKRRGNTLPSNVLGPFIATAPGGGTVHATPTGSQTSTTPITSDYGTGWSVPDGGPNTYRGRWYLDNFPQTSTYIDAATAPTPTFTGTAQTAGALKFGVIAKSVLGIDSAEVFSNTVTLTSPASVTATQVPVLTTDSGHLYLNKTATFSAAQWNVSGYTVVGYTVRRAAASNMLNAVEIRTAGVQTARTFTPNPPPHSDGAVVGQWFDMTEVIQYTVGGVTQTYGATSAPVQLEDTPATFAVSVDIATNTFAAGVVNTFKPTSASGGTAPRTAIAISPSLPGGSNSSLATDGTITLNYGSAYDATHTITWRDGTGATLTTTAFRIVLTSGSGLARVVPVSWEGIGIDVSWNDANPPTITGASAGLADSIVRVQKQADGSYIYRTRQGDPNNFSHHRSEFGWLGSMSIQYGLDYVIAGSFKFPSGENNSISNALGFLQCHDTTDNGDSDLSPTWIIYVFQNSLVMSNKYDISGGQLIGAGGERYFTLSNSFPTLNVYHKIKVHFRPGYLLSQGPRLRVWYDGNLVVNDSAINCTRNAAPDWLKTGIYYFNEDYSSLSSRAVQGSPIFMEQNSDVTASLAKADVSLAPW